MAMGAQHLASKRLGLRGRHIVNRARTGASGRNLQSPVSEQTLKTCPPQKPMESRQGL